VNGAPVRPSREVRVGDRLTLHDPLRATHREIEIRALPERQASRREALAFYAETEGAAPIEDGPP
jgi:ribosomal 50S subunit-recycling heat shock protein